MSMKKKFLALALAGMVAMPVVANASTSGLSHIVQGSDIKEQYGQVTVNGTVETKTGAAPQGQISVELPTAMAFAVDANGDIASANYTVNNKGQKPVKIEVAEFTETRSGAGITVHQSSGFQKNNKKRSDVTLTLTGDHAVDLANVTASSVLFDRIDATSNRDMTLSGTAGTTTDSTLDKNGEQENFTVKFRVVKTN